MPDWVALGCPDVLPRHSWRRGGSRNLCARPEGSPSSTAVRTLASKADLGCTELSDLAGTSKSSSLCI